jgi:peptide/nickel transport system permease protein
MFGYIVRRLVSAFLVVVLTSMIVFLLFFKGPSNPAQPLCDLNGKCTPEKLELLTEQLGLNDSIVHQYGVFVRLRAGLPL